MNNYYIVARLTSSAKLTEIDLFGSFPFGIVPEKFGWSALDENREGILFTNRQKKGRGRPQISSDIMMYLLDILMHHYIYVDYENNDSNR